MEIKKPKDLHPIPENATRVFKGKIFDVYQWEQELYDGTKVTFEKLKRPDTVVVWPVLPSGTILLTKQSQPGRDDFIDVPSGRVDQGEDILEAAKRELLEETGYASDELVFWRSFQPTAKIEWFVYLFIAKDCKKVKEQNPDTGEKIETFEASFDDLLQISQQPNFRGTDSVRDFLEAKYNQEKYQELKDLFFK
jgi:8-oxo-dGTP pyrophosphatase MutT (NUDIX family)